MLPPMADVESGYRMIQALGNTNMQTSWSISALPAGTYYWSVQTIDQAYAGSEFAEEESFMIVATAVNELNQSSFAQVFPNPAADKVYVNSATTTAIEFKIYSVNGQELLAGTIDSGQSIDITSLYKGIYFIHLKDKDETSIQRIIKQ